MIPRGIQIEYINKAATTTTEILKANYFNMIIVVRQYYKQE